MPAPIDPKPAIDALTHMGWRFRNSLKNVPRHGFLAIDPDGREHRLKFQGRNKNESWPQFLFGIHYLEFGNLDDVVLFAESEDAFLILPVAYLQGVFLKQMNKKIEANRWHVSVYFDRHGQAVFHPVWGDAAYVSTHKFSLSVPPTDVPKKNLDHSQSVRIAAKYGAGGETDFHKALKKHVAENPNVVGLSVQTPIGEQEFPLPSGDSIDVYFSHASLRMGVEVKSRISPLADIVRGIFQCIKYRAILRACVAVENSIDAADAVLVLEGVFPEELKSLAERLDVRVIEHVRVP
jgi:hypothetical protein